MRILYNISKEYKSINKLNSTEYNLSQFASKQCRTKQLSVICDSRCDSMLWLTGTQLERKDNHNQQDEKNIQMQLTFVADNTAGFKSTMDTNG